MSRVRLVNAIGNPNTDIGLVEKGKYLTYLFVTNLKYDNPEANNASHILDATEDVVNIDNIKRVLLTPEETAPTEEARYKSEPLDTISILAVRVDEEHLDTDLAAINPDAKLVKADPEKPIYIYYYVDDIESKYTVARLNFDDKLIAIDNIAVFKKPTIEIDETLFAGLPSVYTKFLDTYKKIYNLPPVVESQSNYLLVVDDVNIDSIIAMSMFRNALQANNLNMMSLRSYLKLEDKSAYAAIIFKGVGTEIDDMLTDDSIVLFPNTNKSLVSTIIEFADIIINSNGAVAPRPKTLNYLANILDRLVDIESARFDSELLALRNALQFSGPNGLVNITNNFISNMTAVEAEDGLISVFFTESLGKFYSQAVRFTDALHYNINSVVSSKVALSGDDVVEIVEMKTTEYEEESVLEYLRVNADRQYVLVSSTISLENRELNYLVVGSKIADGELPKLAQLIKGRLLKGNALDSNVVVSEATIGDSQEVVYEFTIKLDELLVI